jgi:ribosomal protein S27AE
MNVKKGSAARDIPTNVCPKCTGFLIKDFDGDSHCLQCGYVAYARLPRHVAATKRERRPSHGGVSL